MELRKKGNARVFVGAGTLLLILVTLYVIISLIEPETGADINTAISGLATAVKG
jgi:hypothetical protein